VHATRIAWRAGAALGLAAMLISGSARPVLAGLVGVAVSGTTDAILWDINETSGAATNPRTVNCTPDRQLDCIAFGTNGILYGVSQGLPSDGPSSGKLYKVNPITGTPTLVATMTMFISVEGDIAIDPTSGTLYAIDGSGGPLFTIDKSTGVGATVGNVGANLDLSAMAFDNSGALFMVDSFTSTLLKVNKATGAVIGTTPMSPAVNGSIGGLAFDPGSGNLYFVGGTTSELYKVNPTSGATIDVGPVPVTDGIYGLTFIPDVTPAAPSTWGRVKGLYR